MSPRLRLLLALPLPLALLAACGGDAGEQRPNVLLVTLDTTRPDFLSTYGYRAGHTPAFDALAEEGARFDNAMATSAVTPVSHASILTGEFQFNHGLRVLVADSGFRLPRESSTLAEHLEAQGYTTLAVHSAFPVSRKFGFERAFDVFRDLNGEMQEGPDGRSGWDTDSLQRRSDQTTDICLEVLEGVQEPFFLWVHYWDPHDPTLLPPDEYLPGERPSETDPGAVKLAWLDDMYAVEVAYVDEQFGRLLEGMRERGLYDNTLVAVTSDHGEGLADGLARHGWRAHRMVYQEQIRVPLILRVPGVQPVGGIPDLVRTVDIAPTVYDYLGLEPPRALDGRSLRPLLEGRPDEPRLGYADQINGYDQNARMVEKRPDAAFLYCVREGDLKLTYRPHDPAASELFDLATDPEELKNLFDPASEDTQRLLERLADLRPWVTAPFPPDGSDRAGMTESLGGLGYAAGEIAEVTWVWACPRHPRRVLAEPARCEDCGGMPIPVKAP